MRVGINLTGLYPGKIGGAEQYVRNIIKKLGEYKDIEVFLFVNNTAITAFPKKERLKTVVVNLDYNHAAQLKGYINLYHIEVWFCPLFHLIPADCGIPNVTAIFDIQQDFFPENFDKAVLSERKRLTKETIENTDLILTISEYSKQTLIEKYHLRDDQVKVTYLDADSSFSLPVDEAKLEQIRKGLPEQFVLFPANMWPHKNHANLIRGFALAKEKYGLPLKLVFTGAEERESQQVERCIEECQMRDHIEYLGYLPQDDMRYVYRCASVLAFPSLFEGFGIPLVEAMASGIPIICSDTSSIPEVAGDAAVSFDGHSPEEISEAIYRVFSDEELREELIRKGRERRNTFSWGKCAEETVEYLRSVYRPREIVKSKLSDHPLVSIVTPSYNQGEYIRATIESILNQTYDNIEYIVMDGGSTDETVEILKEYGDKIKWISEKDNGQADAVNKGINLANGEIIGWLNSDDIYYPNAVEKAVQALLDHPEFDMIYGEGDYIDKDGRVTGQYNTRMFDYEVLANECIICQPTGFFTKDIVVRAGMLDAELQMCMDYELWMRIGKEGRILYIPEKLAASRMYEENKTMSFRDQIYKECCAVTKRHYGYVPYSWIVGYADHLAHTHQKLRRRYYILLLFLKYNYTHPGYFLQCMKGYLRQKKLQKSSNGQGIAPPADGRFSDGWISKEYSKRVAFSGDENELVATGFHYLPFEEPLVLTLRMGERQQFFRLEETGPFTLTMPLPDGASDDDLVTITANETCVPSAVSESSDNRSLSVQVADIFLQKRAKTGRPLVSIITPSYNQGEFLRATIDSVLEQDYENIEYIVVDGGSTDNSLEILKEYGDRLTYISEPDNGQTDALNKGFRMAQGEIVAWLNSDDTYEPGCVSKAVEALSDQPSAALVYGNGRIIDKEGNVLRPFEFNRNFNLWALVHIWDYIVQPTTFFRADALRKVGYLREDLNWIMDWDLWIRLALRYDVAYIDDYLANSREHETTKTSTGKGNRLEELLQLMRHYTKEERPFGYEIYHCAELLQHQRQEESDRKATLARRDHLATFQPTPDLEGRCTAVSNFMVRPFHCAQLLEVEVTEDKEVSTAIYWNGKLLQKQVFTRGITKLPVPQEISGACGYLRVEIDSEDLKNIGQQKDSWVKMRLID